MNEPIILEKLIPFGHLNRPGVKLEAVLAGVVHYTANDAPTATDTANAAYFARKYSPGPSGPTEYKQPAVKFRYGSTQRVADMDSVTSCIPIDEVAWGCGDRQLPWDKIYKGQTHLAYDVFYNRQNHFCLNWEICNNDAIPGSDEDWRRAAANCIWDMARTFKQLGLKPIFEHRMPALGKEILVLRHGDLTGKNCPALYMRYPEEWQKFCNALADEFHPRGRG
jgi:N-acetylmuramoyl-L-alanine amidase CwlA